METEIQMMQDENLENEMKTNQRIGRFQAEIFPLIPLIPLFPRFHLFPPPMSCNENMHDLTRKRMT